MRKKIALASALILSMVLAGCSPDSGSKPASNASALSASPDARACQAGQGNHHDFLGTSGGHRHERQHRRHVRG